MQDQSYVSQNRCKCGYLYHWSKLSHSRVKYNQDIDTYSFDLDNGFFHPINYCPWCGGRDLVSYYEECQLKNTSVCDCGLLERWTIDEKIPVEFDKNDSSFILVLKNLSLLNFAFCISCGGQMVDPISESKVDSISESKIAEFVLAPSEVELSKTIGNLQLAKTMEEVIGLLGEPDQRTNKEFLLATFGNIGDTWENIRESFYYSSSFETFILQVIQYEDENINWLISLKPVNMESVIRVP
jgi:hypothetical protein